MVETTFPTHAGPLPVVDTPAMIEVDRAMIEDFRIELIQMMENAGRNLAHLTRARFLNGDPGQIDRRVGGVRRQWRWCAGCRSTSGLLGC